MSTIDLQETLVPDGSGLNLSQHIIARLAHEDHAWYVDYFTDDPKSFGIVYICEMTMWSANAEHDDDYKPLVMWTNEDKSLRQPECPESVWTGDEIALWFGEGPQHRHRLFFQTTDGVSHVLSMEAGKVTLDGEDRWAEYVDDGVRGALPPLGTIATLLNLEVSSSEAE